MEPGRAGYVGRFAPSPTGPLHAGSLVAALASWLDARAHGGRWLVRIEDVDQPRCRDAWGEHIVQQLQRCGLVPDEPPWWQQHRGPAYAAALQTLRTAGLAYDCACTRRDIEQALAVQGAGHQRFAERPYPGTCRPERGGLGSRSARAQRLWVPPGIVAWTDRRLGPQSQDVAASVGDFILRRADGCWAYQLAVVVDDADQGVTDVVRGEDLADNTARQIVLQRALGLPTPRYLHTPLVRAADGHKLSKQNGADPLDLTDPVAALQAAGAVLGLPTELLQAPAGVSVVDWLAGAVKMWSCLLPKVRQTSSCSRHPPLRTEPPMRPRDLAIPQLPSRSIARTLSFYRRLGFAGEAVSPDGGYAIVERGPIELHFFQHDTLEPATSAFSCYLRVTAVQAWYEVFAQAGLPLHGIPSLHPVEDKPWGMREFALLDEDGNLIRVGQVLAPGSEPAHP